MVEAASSLVVRPRAQGISVRPAIATDITFIDQLQKMMGHELGFRYLAEYEKAIADGACIYVAIDCNGVPFGFIFGKDRYKSQDHVGIIYQLAVVPVKRRSQLASMLVAAFIAGSCRSMKLLCCWCGQDLPANKFWLGIGCVPLAFRTGSRRSQRIHIFWQMRTRSGDCSTPYWYPFETSGGAVRENRMVLPIPRSVHWSGNLPALIPGIHSGGTVPLLPNGLPSPSATPTPQRKALPGPPPTPQQRAAAFRQKHMKAPPAGHVAVMSSSGLKYFRTNEQIAADNFEAPKVKREPRPRNDPVHVRAARELQSAYLDAVAAAPPPVSEAKYDVRRSVPDPAGGISIAGLLPSAVEGAHS